MTTIQNDMLHWVCYITVITIFIIFVFVSKTSIPTVICGIYIKPLTLLKNI